MAEVVGLGTILGLATHQDIEYQHILFESGCAWHFTKQDGGSSRETSILSTAMARWNAGETAAIFWN